MNTRKLSLRLALLALVATTSSALVYGCSSDDNNNGNPAPSSHDGGNDVTVSDNDSGSDAGGGDGPVIDTGSCMSDASTCNSCYTPMQAQQDPLNACAPETANCIPFTGTVPSHPML